MVRKQTPDNKHNQPDNKHNSYNTSNNNNNNSSNDNTSINLVITITMIMGVCRQLVMPRRPCTKLRETKASLQQRPPKRAWQPILVSSLFRECLLMIPSQLKAGMILFYSLESGICLCSIQLKAATYCVGTCAYGIHLPQSITCCAGTGVVVIQLQATTTLSRHWYIWRQNCVVTVSYIHYQSAHIWQW